MELEKWDVICAVHEVFYDVTIDAVNEADLAGYSILAPCKSNGRFRKTDYVYSCWTHQHS